MGLITYLEWLSFELTTLHAGNIGDREHDLASHLIMVNSFSFISVVPLGLANAVSTFVGNSVGEGSAEKAQKIYKVGISLNFVSIMLMCSFIYLIQGHFVGIFSNEEIVQTKLLQLLPIFFLAMVADGTQQVLAGVIKGINKQNIASATYFCSMYVFGQPLTYLLAYVYQLEIKGLWYAYTVGLFAVVFVFFLIMRNLKWNKQIMTVLSRLDTDANYALSVYNMNLLMEE
eukprot:TRINITY_DN10051_c0_g1_i6.p1 TRINITY_DN10051_c0_g1~~TRINITY_DN10051_c0_g1_i6.p1  ORF type:complete len:230 (+),score=18.74 TRINITY_DN10051_c0_g1_i6:102-791(+)